MKSWIRVGTLLRFWWLAFWIRAATLIVQCHFFHEMHHQYFGNLRLGWLVTLIDSYRVRLVMWGQLIGGTKIDQGSNPNPKRGHKSIGVANLIKKGIQIDWGSDPNPKGNKNQSG